MRYSIELIDNNNNNNEDVQITATEILKYFECKVYFNFYQYKNHKIH